MSSVAEKLQRLPSPYALFKLSQARCERHPCFKRRVSVIDAKTMSSSNRCGRVCEPGFGIAVHSVARALG